MEPNKVSRFSAVDGENRKHRCASCSVLSLLRRKVYIVSYCVMLLTFVLGAILFYLVMECHLLLIDSKRRPEVARLYIHRGARLLFWTLQTIGLAQVKIDLTGCPSKAVIIANHPSMLDAMLMLSALPNAVCIMKRPLLRLPIIGGFARRAHYIPQAEPPELLKAAKEVLATGASIIVFPEGTRSRGDEMGAFKRGAARLALEACSPIVPVSIVMSPVVLGPQWPFERPPKASIRYEAVRLAPTEGEFASFQGEPAENIRTESMRLTRYLEDRMRNSLL